MKEVQTRNIEGELRFFSTVKEAIEHSKKDLSVWKISYSLENGERVKLVRNGKDPEEVFYYEPIDLGQEYAEKCG